MKSDLRNLVTAQEGYSADNGAYYGGAVPNAVLTYNPSSGIGITIYNASPGGWAAVASMPAVTTKTCALFIGSAPPQAPATVEGQILCN